MLNKHFQSTITMWGKEGELQAFEKLITEFPSGSVACVSDSYDLYKACNEYWSKNLKNKVMNRNGTLTIRPDSGDPTEILPNVLNILGENFGFTTNSKGFKVLPSYLHLSQFDGIEIDTLGWLL